MNEFFACPSYAWGYTIIFMIFALNVWLMVGDLKDPQQIMANIGSLGMSTMIFGFLTFGWTIWCLINWFSRSPMCARVGFPKGEFKAPWSQASGIPVP